MAIEVGSILEGTISGITNFGAFVELPEGKVGLVHISEVADEYVKDVKDFLKEKDKVKVKVLSIDEKGKIGLSIKRLQPKKPAEPSQNGNAGGRGFNVNANTGANAGRSFQSRPQAQQKPEGEAAGFQRKPFRPASSAPDFRRSGGGSRFSAGSASFEDKISKFMKDSEEILRDSSRRTDSKRGGRGGRRR